MIDAERSLPLHAAQPKQVPVSSHHFLVLPQSLCVVHEAPSASRAEAISAVVRLTARERRLPLPPHVLPAICAQRQSGLWDPNAQFAEYWRLWDLQSLLNNCKTAGFCYSVLAGFLTGCSLVQRGH